MLLDINKNDGDVSEIRMKKKEKRKKNENCSFKLIKVDLSLDIGQVSFQIRTSPSSIESSKHQPKVTQILK